MKKSGTLFSSSGLNVLVVSITLGSLLAAHAQASAGSAEKAAIKVLRSKIKTEKARINADKKFHPELFEATQAKLDVAELQKEVADTEPSSEGMTVASVSGQ